jgi:hypothetical protein
MPRMGRPPIGKRAMTNAKRQRRYRNKIKSRRLSAKEASRREERLTLIRDEAAKIAAGQTDEGEALLQDYQTFLPADWPLPIVEVCRYNWEFYVDYARRILPPDQRKQARAALKAVQIARASPDGIESIAAEFEAMELELNRLLARDWHLLAVHIAGDAFHEWFVAQERRVSALLMLAYQWAGAQRGYISILLWMSLRLPPRHPGSPLCKLVSAILEKLKLTRSQKSVSTALLNIRGPNAALRQTENT